MEIIRVPDILIYRSGSLHSLRGQQVMKNGELHTFGSGSGLVKAGKLYVLDGEDYVVRMVTGKRSISIGFTVTEAMTVDWGDGTSNQCYTGNNGVSHDYTDNLDAHTILLKGSAAALTELYCQNNELTVLDIMPCIALSILHCHSNLLASLDINPNICNLECSNNRLTALDIQHNTGLSRLTCCSNQLTRLDVSNNHVLDTLFCGDNPLNTLNLSHTNALMLLNCADTPLLNKVDVANSLPARNGLPSGSLYLNEIVASVQDICAAKNWEVTIY